MKSVLAFALTLVACLQVAQAAPAIEARAPTVAKYLCNLPPGDPGELTPWHPARLPHI